MGWFVLPLELKKRICTHKVITFTNKVRPKLKLSQTYRTFAKAQKRYLFHQLPLTCVDFL